MSPLSYADVFNLDQPRAEAHPIGPGDIVCSGANHFPYYEVLAANGEKAWVRNVATGEDHLVAIARCRHAFGCEVAQAA
jgi:hypothetical protein